MVNYILSILALEHTGRFRTSCKIRAKQLHDSHFCSIRWVRKCRLRPLSCKNDPGARSVDNFSIRVWFIDGTYLCLCL